jgi:dTDP-4-dehydrorhamnose reductase
VLHIAGADPLDRHEFACLLVAAQGHDPSTIRSSATAEPGLSRPRNCALDSGRARSLLATEVRGARAVLAPPGAHP